MFNVLKTLLKVTFKISIAYYYIIITTDCKYNLCMKKLQGSIKWDLRK